MLGPLHQTTTQIPFINNDHLTIPISAPSRYPTGPSSSILLLIVQFLQNVLLVASQRQQAAIVARRPLVVVVHLHHPTGLDDLLDLEQAALDGVQDGLRAARVPLEGGTLAEQIQVCIAGDHFQDFVSGAGREDDTVSEVLQRLDVLFVLVGRQDRQFGGLGIGVRQIGDLDVVHVDAPHDFAAVADEWNGHVLMMDAGYSGD